MRIEMTDGGNASVLQADRPTGVAREGTRMPQLVRPVELFQTASLPNLVPVRPRVIARDSQPGRSTGRAESTAGSSGSPSPLPLSKEGSGSGRPPGGGAGGTEMDGVPEEHFTIKNVLDLQGPIWNRVSIRRDIRRGVASIPRTDVSFAPGDPGPSGEMQEDHFERVWSKWNALKLERNELLGCFIEEIWQKVGEVRKDITSKGEEHGYRSGLGRYTFTGNRLRPDLMPVDRERLKDDTPIIDQLKGATKTTMREGLKQWSYEREARLAELSEEELTDEDKQYGRLKEIIEFGHRNLLTQSPTVEAFVDAGIFTNVNTVWGLFDVSSRVFKEKYNNTPTREEADELFESTETLVVQLAAGNIDLATSFLGFLSGLEQPDPEGTPFLTKYFKIEEQRDAQEGHVKRKLAIKKEALKEFVKQMLQEDPQDPHKITENHLESTTTGCPALAALSEEPEGGERKLPPNVVIDSFNWSLAVAREYYLPTFPKKQ